MRSWGMSKYMFYAIVLLALSATWAHGCTFTSSTSLTNSLNCSSLYVAETAIVTFFDAAAPYAAYNVCVTNDIVIRGALIFGSVGASVISTTGLYLEAGSRLSFKQLVISAYNIKIQDGARIDGKGTITQDDAVVLGIHGTFGRCNPGSAGACGGGGGYHYFSGSNGFNTQGHEGQPPQTYDDINAPGLPGAPGGLGRNSTFSTPFDDSQYGLGGGSLFVNAFYFSFNTTTTAVDVSGGDSDHGGGGAGGSIFVRVQDVCNLINLVHVYTFLANGGNSQQGGGASGGLIIVDYQNPTSTPCLNPAAEASKGTGANDGTMGYFDIICVAYVRDDIPCTALGAYEGGSTATTVTTLPSGTGSPSSHGSTNTGVDSTGTTIGNTSTGTGTTASTNANTGSTGASTSTTAPPAGSATLGAQSTTSAISTADTTSTVSSTGATADGSSTATTTGNAALVDTPSTENGSSTTTIIAVIGCLFLMILLIVAVVMVLRHRRRQPQPVTKSTEDSPTINSVGAISMSPTSSTQTVKATSAAEMTTLAPVTANPSFQPDSVVVSYAAPSDFLDSKIFASNMSVDTTEATVQARLDPQKLLATLASPEEFTRMLALQSSVRIFVFNEESTVVSDLSSLGESTRRASASSSALDEGGDDMTTHFSLRNAGRSAQVKELLAAPTTRLLGSGLTADVFAVKYPRLGEVAVKKFKLDDMAAQAEFHAEVAALSRVANRSHPHVLGLVFICAETSALAIVVEMADGGSLASVLTGALKLSDKARRATVGGIASGMAFLHLSGVVHLDLKPANVLRTKAGVVKIADFGTSVIVDGSDEVTTGAFVGTPRYSAPERLVAGRRIHLKPADVYSFGLTIWAVYACQPPPAEGDNVAALARSRSRADSVMPRAWAEESAGGMHDLIARCCLPDPARRPTFDEVLSTLSKP